jgi:hypothetical protein
MNDTTQHPDDFANAFESAFARLQVAVEEACAREAAWPAKIAAAIAAALEFALADPAAARTLTLAAPVQIPKGTRRHHRNLPAHYRLSAKVGGTIEKGSDEAAKTLGLPFISKEQVQSAAYTEATIKGLVNPEGFAGSYRFEYGPTAAYGQSTTPISFGADRPAIANLSGLTQGTTYHWRIRAANGAIFNGGISEGEDRTFTTYQEPSSEGPCENEVLRSGASALLPTAAPMRWSARLTRTGGASCTGLEATCRAPKTERGSPTRPNRPSPARRQASSTTSTWPAAMKARGGSPGQSRHHWANANPCLNSSSAQPANSRPSHPTSAAPGSMTRSNRR